MFLTLSSCAPSAEMPRPIRRPKRVGAGQDSADVRNLAASPVALTRDRESASRGRSQTVLSDDEFGVHELQAVHPVYKRARRSAAGAVFDILGDSEGDLESTEGPVVTRVPQHQVSPILKVLKTTELQNMLPRRNLESKKRETRTGKEHGAQRSRKKSTREQTGCTRPQSARSNVIAKKYSNRRQARVHSDDESDTETRDEDSNLNSGFTKEELMAFKAIREKFREVDDWSLESETLSSNFYSS